MKELRIECLRLAGSLESRWTRQADKRAAAILLRNSASTAPACSFCGIGENEYGLLCESWYDPKVRICRLCIRELATLNACTQTASANDASVASDQSLTRGVDDKPKITLGERVREDAHDAN